MTVRLYQIYNSASGELGEPFGCCDVHAKSLQEHKPLMRYAVMVKLSDISAGPCEDCEQERNNDTDTTDKQSS
jgi:hypothetical protein